MENEITKQPEAVAQPKASEPSLEERVHNMVSKWITDCIHGGPVAHVTSAYNHLVESCKELEARIVNHINGKE